MTSSKEKKDSTECWATATGSRSKRGVGCRQEARHQRAVVLEVATKMS